MNILTKGSVFEKSKTLREKQHIIRDNGDNPSYGATLTGMHAGRGL